MNNEEVLEKLLANKDIKKILRITESLNLKEACICAGTLRNNIWNILDNKKITIDTDVDVIFYDENISYEETYSIERELNKKYMEYNIELKNQVYMHVHNPEMKPYKNVEDAISKFPETCTAIGLRKVKEEYEWIVPYGLNDVLNKIVRPTKYFNNPKKINIFKDRVNNKKWVKKWNNMVVKYDII